jgi:hypothetical protein
VFGQSRKRASLVLTALFLNIAIINPIAVTASNPCPNTNAFDGISSLTLWLRADCVTGNGADPADNTILTAWTDLSGNGNNATAFGSPTYQSDTANLINSQPVVNFNGSSTFTSIDIRAITRPNITIFAVYKLRSSNNVGIWGADDGGWDRFFMARWSGDNGIISHSGQTAVPNSGLVNTPTLVTTVYKYGQSNGSSVYFNGDTVAAFTDSSNASAAQTTLRIGSIGAIGSGYQLIGDIAEIIIFSQALGESDRKIVNGYLNTKYNLGMSLSNIPSNITFNSLTIEANAIYRKVTAITANVSAASKVTFKVRNKVIPGCKRKLTSVNSPFIATCLWKTSNRGPVVISASAFSTSTPILTATATPITAMVSNRTGPR